MRRQGFSLCDAIRVLVIVIGVGSCSGDGGTNTDDDGNGENNPPSTITDMSVAGVTPSSVTLRWKAPHGGSPTLLAHSYDLRLAAGSITEASWGSAMDVQGEPPPLPMGMEQTMSVTGLPADTTLYFAIKSRNMGGIWSAVSNSVAAVLPPESEVSIPDANLESLIRGIVGKPTGPLMSSDLATLTAIEADEKGIESLEGLQYCTSLRLINMRGNEVSDLGPLASLLELTSIGASDNEISSVQPLAGLTRLVNLFLGGNAISNIAPLASLTNLNFLYLNGNPIADLSPLSSLVRLNHLFIAGTGTTAIDDLEGLVNLATLDIGFNAITDLAPLVSNPGIGSGDEIWVAGNPLSDTSRNVHIPALRARGAIVHDR